MVYLDFFLWTAIRGEMQGPGWGQEMQFSGSTVGEAELAVVDLVLSQSVSHSVTHRWMLQSGKLDFENIFVTAR